MITERGRVVGLGGDRGDQVWVQTIQQSACESCSARAGCGQKVLASLSAGRANQILVDNSQDVALGDDVRVAIADSALLQASLLVYALPLALLMMGALLGQQFLPGPDAGAIAGAALGLAAGFAVTYWTQRHLKAAFVPYLLPAEAASLARVGVSVENAGIDHKSR